MNEDEALARVASARLARMATVDPQGTPHVIPVTFALDGRIVYWAVDQKPKRAQEVKRLDNLRASPTVQLVVDHYDEDWAELWWVRLTGRGRILEAGEERERAMGLLAGKYSQYRADPPQGSVVAIDVEAISTWEATPT
jgi:PPOX class probable F420-dependent enzyme